MEVIARVALNLFTNYVDIALAVPADFPTVGPRPQRKASERSKWMVAAAPAEGPTDEAAHR